MVRIYPEWVTNPDELIPAVGLLPLASRKACFGMAFLPLLMKELYRCGLVVTASFVGAGCRVRLKPYGTR